MSEKTKKSDIESSDLQLTLSFDKIHTCPLCTGSILEWYNESRHSNFDFCRRTFPNPTYHNAKECEGEYILLEILHGNLFSSTTNGVKEPIVDSTMRDKAPPHILPVSYIDRSKKWKELISKPLPTPDNLRPLVMNELTRLDNLRLKNNFSKIRSKYTNFTKKILQDIISNYLTPDEAKSYWNIRRTLWPHQIGGRDSMRGS